MKNKRWLFLILVLEFILLVGGTICLFLLIRPKDETVKDTFQAFSQEVRQEDVKEENGVWYTDSQLLLTAVRNASYKEVSGLVAEYGGEIIGYISFTNDYQILFQDGKSYEELEKTATDLSKNKIIADVSLSYVAELTNSSVDYTKDSWIDDSEPEDFSGRQWNEERPGGKNWWAEAIHMPSVWQKETEYHSVKVGIVDTMFDIDNTDLENKFVKLWNNLQDANGKCLVADAYGKAIKNNDETAIANASHGTHVAGIIAAQAENGFGIAGICQNAELYGYSTMSSDTAISEESTWMDIMMLKVALANLLNEGVSVINISMGCPDALVGAQDGNAYWKAFVTRGSSALQSFLQNYMEQEFLIIKSAGNEKHHDALYDIFGAISDEPLKKRIIMVGALDDNIDDLSVADFSNIGERIDIYAPGKNILSVVPANKVVLKSGTSMAAPVITGIASLIWGINENLSAEQVRTIILASRFTDDFTYDGRSETLVNKMKYKLDAMPVPNALVCQELAQESIGKIDGEIAKTGIITGMMFRTIGPYLEEAKTNTVEIYDSQGNLVRELQAAPVECGISEPEGAETDSMAMQKYNALLPCGTYILRAREEGIKEIEQEITVIPNKVQIADFDFHIDLLGCEMDSIPPSDTISNEAWKIAYTEYVKEKYDMDVPFEYKLVNVDGTDCPELYINYSSISGGDELCIYYNGSIKTQHMYNYGFSYIEGQNLILDSGGRSGQYYDTVYRIQNGEFIALYNGEYFAEYDEEDNETDSYYVDGLYVSSENEYKRLLHEIFDEKVASNPYDGAEFDMDKGMYVGNGLCDYDEILIEIENY